MSIVSTYASHTNTTECRACGSSRREEILSLGETPLADGLLTDDQLDEVEPRFPLTVLFCKDCSLVQIRENVETNLLFGEDYPYYSSFLPAWLKHCRENALELMESRQLTGESLVIELASNDGYLLKNFKEQGIPVLGIDPAPGPVRAAEQQGIPSRCEFFTLELAEELSSQGTKADVVLANNVLAHVPDLRGFAKGISTILKDDGVAVIEVPYVKELIEGCEFDTIYHEHHCYFSVTALSALFERAGLSLNDVRELPTHGGSLRLFVEKHVSVSESVHLLLEEEKALGLDSSTYYQDFAERVRRVQETLAWTLTDLHESGKRIAAYAAAAKGATLLNSSGVGSDLIEYVVDRNSHKHGRYMPGIHLPIEDVSKLLDDQPDYVLMLAWNFKDEILEQQSEFRRRGGKFIVPLPELAII